MTVAATTAKTTAKPDTLAKALVVFQSAIPVITKDSKAEVGKYGYEYASLPMLTPILFKALTDVGLSYVTVPDMVDGNFVLRATLLHVSGESISGNYPLGSPTLPAQQIGSNITYARRYALLSMTGVSPEGSDDDGAAGSQGQAQANTQASAPAAAKADVKTVLRAEMGDLINGSGGKLTGEDANRIMAEVTGGKEPAVWTAAHLKAGKAQLEALIEERS